MKGFTYLAIADRLPRKPIKEIIAEMQVDVIITMGDLTLFEV